MRKYSSLKLLLSFALLVSACNGSEFSEAAKSLSRFIRALDPENVLKIEPNETLSDRCSYKWKGVITCNQGGTAITGIRLVNMSLTGILDTESLCKLRNLKVLNLARNGLRGTIPDSISRCRNLAYLNLSGNALSGRVPLALSQLRKLKKLDLSQNHFTAFNHIVESNVSRKEEEIGHEAPPASRDSGHKKSYQKWEVWVLIVVLVGIVLLVIIFLNLNSKKRRAKEKEMMLESLAHHETPSKSSSQIEETIVKRDEKKPSELVFFVEKEEWFDLDELLEGAADLRAQGFYSSLYVVQIKNGSLFAVKRLKKLKVSLEEFGSTMKRISNLKHPNILPLICYNSTRDEKLIVYRYQRNGSLLNLLEYYVEGKSTFPWKLRLSIAIGIARGLDYIYGSPNEIIPHGNLKLSNIMLSDEQEPLISEYGYAKFMDPTRACLFSNGYSAPEKILTERADVYSFGVILLELLTGKIVEKSGLDLPRWVRAKVREEWTGEVFDREVSSVETYAFSMLNVALKCVANRAEERPDFGEVLENIEKIVNAYDEENVSPVDCNQ